MSNVKSFDHSGSTFDSFLEEEHILQEAEAVALKRVLAWKFGRAMKQRNMSKYTLAKEMNTSRSQVDRLLDPSHIGVTIGTITRAATTLGKQIRVEIVDAKLSKDSVSFSAAKRQSKGSTVSFTAKRSVPKQRTHRKAKAAYAAG
ncbi:MAG TPA: helix-turn-helix transcriptional regulator [Candidatus Sulfotelmatobacter sp.]